MSDSPSLTPPLAGRLNCGLASPGGHRAAGIAWTIDPHSRFLSPKFLAVSVIALLVGLRLLVAATLVLLPEEAYYWMYSKYPAWGYLDHPPIVAWLISLGTSIFGQTEIGVRIATWALGCVSTGLCFLLASEWYGRRAGLSTAVLFSISPMFFGAGFLAMPDAPLIFFWLVTLVGVSKAYHGGSLGWWILAGAGLGLGFMSKYPAAFLIPSTFLFLLSDERGRHMLRSPAPWLALLLAAMLAVPVVFWNATNDWASFQFQLSRRLAQQVQFAPHHTPMWLAGQFLLLSPLVFLLLMVTLWVAIRRFRRDTSGHYRFAVCFAVPWLLMCVWHGLHTSAKINWPLPAYLSLFPTAVVVLRGRGLPILRSKGWTDRRRFVRRYTFWGAAILAVVSIVAVARLPFIPLPGPIAPWHKLGASVEVIEDAHEQKSGRAPFMITDGKYRLASELGFYMQEEEHPEDNDWRDVIPMAVASGGGLAFNYWRDLGDFVGRDAVYITDEPTGAVAAVLADLFDNVDPARPFFSHSRAFSGERTYWVISCSSFRGIPSK